MSAHTRTTLTNLALREIGTDRIEVHTESSPEADVANDVWDQAVAMTLARHEWRFALKSASLPRSATAPTAGYAYAYTLPGDFLRLGTVSQYQTLEPPLMLFDVTEAGIETDATYCYVRYVYNAPAIGTWPAWFVSVFVCDLASLMAAPLKSGAERERLEQLADKRLAAARTLDSQHRKPQTYRDGSWVQAARGMRVR